MINIIKEETIETSIKTLPINILEHDNTINEMYEDNVLDDEDIKI